MADHTRNVNGRAIQSREKAMLPAIASISGEFSSAPHRISYGGAQAVAPVKKANVPWKQIRQACWGN